MEPAKRGQDTKKPQNFKQMVSLPPNQRARAQARSVCVAPKLPEPQRIKSRNIHRAGWQETKQKLGVL